MTSIMTPTGILSFPALWTPRPPAPNAEPRYNCNIVFDRAAQATPEYQELRRAVAGAINDKWGAGKSQDKVFLAKTRLPFRPCSEKDYSGYNIEGGVFINPWSKNRPGVVDARRNDIHVASDVWAGQLCRATVHVFAYDTAGNRGVAFNLNNLQIVKADMPRLDGRRPAKDEFPDAEGEDAMAGADADYPPF